jgi:predicted Zn-dependent protease
MILAGLCAVGLSAALRDRRKEVAWGAAALAASLASNQFLALTLPTAIWLYATIAAVVGARAWATTGDAGGTSKGLRAAAAIVAAAMLWGACSLTVADRRLEAVRERLQAKDFDGASQRYREFMAIRPAGMTADLWYAYNTRDRGAAERATLAAEDRQNAWVLLAQIAAEQGDAVTVEAALREAIDAAPNWYKPRWTLGRLLRQGGREEQAVEQLRRAAELAGGFYPELETEARR